ncbi:MAG: DUF1631 domain-containing protein [Burkholderiales bacterium]|nr:DUF1631 domain-containing protein [Burkholderiales bacterium]
MNSIEPRVQAALDAAMNLIRTAATSAAMRVAEILDMQAQNATRPAERELVFNALQELRRNMGMFQGAFHEAMRERVAKDLTPAVDNKRKLESADWETLSLVDVQEVETQMNYVRLGQLISHECEWQLRDLAAYMGSLLGLGRADDERNPLRAEIIGAALNRGIEAISGDREHRRLYTRELGQTMALAMPDCYAQIVKMLQERGIQPVHLTVRTVEGPGNQIFGANSGYASLPRDGRNSTRSGHGDLDEPSGSGDLDLLAAHRRALATAFPSGHPAGPDSIRDAAPAPRGGSGRGAGSQARSNAAADQQLMTLLRRLTAVSQPGELGPVGLLGRPAGGHGGGGYGGGGYGGGYGGGQGGGYSGGPGGPAGGGGSGDGYPGGGGMAGGHPGYAGTGYGGGLPGGFEPGIGRPGFDPAGRPALGADSSRGAPNTGGGPNSGGGGGGGGGGAGGMGGGSGTQYSDGLTGMMAVNLIRAHREELIQASTGKLDHMVIDVVGSLFDQILSDSRVPPQMAREIARLQLPVLRVALNDSSFFSTRRHPVRRFINKIASLANAFDDFEDGPGAQFLLRVRKLVDEIIEGDFDQIELYAAKIAELERFISEQTEGEIEEKSGAVTTLEAKESELRVQQRYMLQLQSALGPMSLPPYLQDFLAQVWSQALVLAVRRDGAESDRARRYRRVGTDLVMSVQPKGSPMFRKKFLMQLPPLMKDLNEGMRLIGWPEAAQKEFFAKLLPAHAESLKGQPLSELDHNMKVKQLEGIFAIPVPMSESFSRGEPIQEVADEVIEKRFTPEEAKKVGFVAEAAVDWTNDVDASSVDIDLGEEMQPAEPVSASVAAVLDPETDSQLGPSTSESGEAGEPTKGPQLIDHIKLGFAYQMHLKDDWQKVRLAHVSSGRSFFVFTRGGKHQETISMTSRMLARMCETGRFRAVESAYLMERATQRARKQLAELKAPTKH